MARSISPCVMTCTYVDMFISPFCRCSGGELRRDGAGERHEDPDEGPRLGERLLHEASFAELLACDLHRREREVIEVGPRTQRAERLEPDVPRQLPRVSAD